jgi:hypothetical protein
MTADSLQPEGGAWDLKMAKISRRDFAIGLTLPIAASFAANAQTSPSPEAYRTRHPALRQAVDHFTHRQWGYLARLVRALPPESACVLIDDIGDVTAIDATIDGLAREVMGGTIAGGLLVNWGWRIRGSGFGASVGQAAFSEFQRRLQGAREALNGALARDADDGIAAAFLIRTEKGRQDLEAADVAFQKFEQSTRRPIAGYSDYADAISAKWYGSSERMLGFARQHRASLTPESQGLIPQAHIEAMWSLARSSDAQSVASASSYFTGNFVRAEIMTANDAFHSASPDPDVYANRFAYGEFSFAFVQMGERDLARPHVAGMGSAPWGPWGLMPNADHVLQLLRQDLGLADL